MLAFITAIIALILLALALLIPALIRKNRLEADRYDQENTRIARERLAELKKDLAEANINQQEYDQVKDELEQSLAMDLSQVGEEQTSAVENSDKSLAITLLVLIPLLSILTYSQLGRFDSLDGSAAQEIAGSGHEEDEMSMSMEQAVAQLAERLQQQPDNAEGWFMLARSLMSMQRYGEAAKAFGKTVALMPGNADILLAYADALAMSEGGRLSGKAYVSIKQALEIDAQNLQGLWMQGMAANETGDYHLALSSWYQLMPMLNDNIEAQTQLRSMIASVEPQLGPDALSGLRAQYPVEKQAPVASVASITVSVSLDDSMKDKVSASDTLFILARAVSGPPMPLAAVRKQVSDLPIEVVLDDSLAMMPEMKLSGFEQVKVTAIVSKAGTAGLKSGDLYGEVTPVAVKAGQQISVLIDQIQ
ncbi:MAG: c-type cytochrome biogenesis protein CcmI [Gammaproteobacteria bacterium]